MSAVGYLTGDPAKVDVSSVGEIGGPAGPLDGSGLIPSAQIPGGGGGGGPSLAGTVTSETTYGAGSAAGSAATASRGDHTHGTPALTSSAPTNSAVGDAAAVGAATAPARADHAHGRESFGTPGASAVGDTVAAGSALTLARSDHRHSREGFGNVTAQTSFGASSSNGSAATLARSDHVHGTPAAPTPAGIGAATDHAYAPADYGLLGWVADPGYVVSGFAPTTGVVHLLKVKLPSAVTITNINIQMSGSSTLTAGQNFAALYDTSGTRLGITADQSSAWATTGSKTCALTAPVSVPAGYVYVALLFNGTPANLGRYAQSTQFSNANLPFTGLRWCQFGSALTAMPSSITMASTVIDAAAAFWAGVS